MSERRDYNESLNLQPKAKSKALKSKMYTSPTGSKHRIGSQKHRYWESIVKRGEDNKKAGVPND